MEAQLKTYGKRRIIDIQYSTATDGHDWTSMIERAKTLCNVEQEHVQVIFSQVRTQEAFNARR